MAKLLLARETIYKEEVDMIIAGKKTEEIVKIMEEKEKARKDKEERLKKQRDQQQKLDNYKKKIAEGENLVKMGIISEDELEAIKKESQEFEKSLKIEAENFDKKEEKADNKEEPKKRTYVRKKKDENNNEEDNGRK